MDTDDDYGLFRGIRSGRLIEAVVAVAALLILGSNLPDLIADAIVRTVQTIAAGGAS